LKALSSIAIISSLIAVVTLTGCVPEEDDNTTPSYSEDSIEHYGFEPAVISYSQSGEITRVISVNGTSLYEGAYQSSDESLIYEDEDLWKLYLHRDTIYGDSTLVITGNDSLVPSHRIDSTVTINGKPYPVSAMLNWTVFVGYTFREVVEYFNHNVANPETSTGDLLKWTPLVNVVNNRISELFSKDLDLVLANLQFETIGRSVTVADERIATGVAAGTPAWVIQQEITGNSVRSEKYYYSYLCATYDVGVSNEEGVFSLLDNLVGVDDTIFNIQLELNETTLLVETAQPCAILPYDESHP
jgi:hypothetical protein